MREYKSFGTICVKDKYGFIYALCKIEYILNEDDNFKYIFKPNYSVIELLGPNLFQGIPGLNLDLKKEEYIRDNINPTFISERVPSKNREDYYELLSSVNMTYMDPIKYLILTKDQYSGDNLFVIPYEEKKIIEINSSSMNNITLIKNVLLNLCLGNDIMMNDTVINDDTRKAFYNTFLPMYIKSYNFNKLKQKEGIEKAKREGKYKGRKPIKVDMLVFNDLQERLEKKQITRQQLLDYLGISKDKYYRLKKYSQK